MNTNLVISVRNQPKNLVLSCGNMSKNRKNVINDGYMLTILYVKL